MTTSINKEPMQARGRARAQCADMDRLRELAFQTEGGSRMRKTVDDDDEDEDIELRDGARTLTIMVVR